jgi:hypothetical protein
VDPGYNLCKPRTVHHKLAQAGIHQTFQPVAHQRGIRPFSGDALLIDGQLFSSLLPEELRGPPVAARGASEAEKAGYQAKFNLRARWRMMRHAGPDAAGATRWRCPFCSGFLRSRSFPRTMRRAKTAPLVPVDDGCERCCNGILTTQAVEMAWWQRITYGTTAWRISMGRRQVVESVNAALKGASTDLGRGFMRVMGVTKMTVMLGFTLAAFNLDRIRSFRAKHALDEEGRPTERRRKTRARRRVGTWSDVIEPTDPPPE